MKNSLLFLGIGGIVALFILVGFVFWQRERTMPQVQPLPPSPSQARPEPTPRPTPTPTVQPPNLATWKTYRNEEYGFEVKYPENMEVSGPGVKYNPLGKVEQSKFGFIIQDKKYRERVEGEVPELIITNYPYGPVAKDKSIFGEEDVLDYTASIYFSVNGQRIYAKCLVYNLSEKEIHSMLSLCNQILSTLKLAK